jgi:hypothetical protein
MCTRYPTLTSDDEIRDELREMGIDVFLPETRTEENTAQALEEFSTFVLFHERVRCLEILEHDLNSGGGSVGELQGGNNEYSIYRVSFPDTGDDGNEVDNATSKKKSRNAAIRLLQQFNNHTQQAKRHSNPLTMNKIQQYMLGMCNRRSQERCCMNYTSLGNFMLILSFGSSEGQVRHIDNMIPNLQICLYMSPSCPSTIVYAMDDADGQPVTDGNSLIEFWERSNKTVPQLVKKMLQTSGDRLLKKKWYTKYFAFWKTIDSHLNCFGKLYQAVSYQLGFRTDPGTTLIAGGNEIHAGPPHSGPRMFAFAIGRPDNPASDDVAVEDENDGEVQYSPVLLHIDVCCLFFTLLDYEYTTSEESGTINESKLFLMDILMDLIRDYPMRAYLRQIDEERVGIRTWLEHVLDLIERGDSISTAVESAINSDEIFYTPDVVKRRSKKKRTKPK